RIVDEHGRGEQLPLGVRPAATVRPLHGGAVPTLRSPGELLLDFPCRDRSTEDQKCHYIMRYSIGKKLAKSGSFPQLVEDVRLIERTEGVQVAGVQDLNWSNWGSGEK